MAAYLVMMAARMTEMWRVLKPTGSYTALRPDREPLSQGRSGRDLRSRKFSQRIVWKRTTAKSLSFRNLPNNHDLLLLYSNGVLDTDPSTLTTRKTWTVRQRPNIAISMPMVAGIASITFSTRTKIAPTSPMNSWE